MFNVPKIQDKLYGVVGWRQPLNPDFDIVDAANLISRSGYFINDNPYAKIQYLHGTQDYAGISDIDFNTKLAEIQKSAISEVCNLVFNKTDYIDRQILFANANNKVTTDTLPSGLVCYKIEIDRTKNVAFEIKRVFLDFEGAGQITLMLFNSAEVNPIETMDIIITSKHQEVELNWIVDNSGSTYKGEYYLGYLTNDIDIGTLKPYKRDYNDSDIMSVITHLNITRISFPGVAVEELPDLEADDGLSENIGVNPDILIYEDYTDLIKQNETLFGRAVYLSTAIRCASIYLASNRSNMDARKAEQVVLRITKEIEGQNADGFVKITGLRPMLVSEINRIGKEIEKLNDGYFANEITMHTLT